MIDVTDLRVDYDDLCAVRDLNMNIGAGEVCGLIGPNGAGKTSTMRAMVGLLEPTYGTIRIGGIDALEEPERVRQLIGFMPDFAPVYEDLKCWEYLEVFAAAYKIPKNQRAGLIDRELARVNLTEKRDVPAGTLSRGMRQRLTLAKTLLPDPSVLFLDEPASGLDPNARIELKQIIRSLSADGKTVLVSSHILSEMSEFCTCVAIMERGKVVVQGSIAEVEAKFTSGLELKIRVLDRTQEVLSWLSGHHQVASAMTEKDASDFLVTLTTSDESTVADLLAGMIQAGFRVSSFSQRRERLEDIFLKVGAKEVS